MTQEDILNLGLLISPILLIQIGIVVYTLFDLSKRTAVRGKRWLWALLLVSTAFALPSGLLVAAVYLVWGRTPSDHLSNK